MPESSPLTPRPLSKPVFWTGFTLFLVIMGSAFWGMMKIAAPRLAALQKERPQFFELTEVLRGDALLATPNLGGRLKKTAAPIPVRIRGIQAPPDQPGPAADAFAARVGCPPAEVPALGRASRNAVKAWIYKQSNLLLDFDRDHPVHDADGFLLARAEIGHVDIGRIQLREGQAILSDEDHPLRGIYEAAEAEARAAKAGVWRWKQ